LISQSNINTQNSDQMKFTAYYRVSTKQQGKSGLGLDAQKEAVRRYVTGKGEAVPPPFIEVESGKKMIGQY